MRTYAKTGAHSGLGAENVHLLRVRRERLIIGIGFSLFVLIGIEIMAQAGVIRQIFLPAMSSVLVELWEGVSVGWLWPHLRATALVWIVGYTLGSAFGIVLGLVIGVSKRVHYIASPWLNASYVVPDLALIPIFILVLGIGYSFKIWLVFLSGFFYVAVNTIEGVHASEAKLLAVARSFGATRLKTVRSVVLPGSVPYIVTGLKVAAGRALVGAVAAEFVASNIGLGFMTSVAGQTFNTPRVMVGILILSMAGIGISWILGKAEDHFEPWRL